MDVVALMSLATTAEVEAPKLAADLGSTAYETALLLRTPSPVLLLRTDDRARALELLGKLRSRGHDAVACDAAAVVAAASMVHVRSFRFEAEAFVVTTPEAVEHRIAWVEIIAIVRAMHRTRTEEVSKTSERSFSLGRAALSGGVLLTKQMTRTTKQTNEEREQVLYVFRRGGVPVLVTLSRARYEGLGAELRAVQIENFATLIGMLREHAPDAAFDERLIGPRPAIERIRAQPGGGSSASSSDGIDLFAHVIALALARGARPYR